MDNSLPPLERALLEAIAVSMVYITRTQMTKALRSLGHKTPRGTVLSSAALAEPYAVLEQRGLVDRTGTCPRELEDAITLVLVEAGVYGRIAKAVAAASPLKQERTYGGEPDWRARGPDHFAREIRICLLGADWEGALRWHREALTTYDARYGFLSRAVLEPLSLPWLDALPGALARPLLQERLSRACRDLESVDDLVQRASSRLSEEDDPSLRQALAEYLVLAGRFDETDALLADGASAASLSLEGLRLFIDGCFDAAVARWEEALVQHRKEAGTRSAVLCDRAAPFFPLALVAAGSLDRAAQIARALERADDDDDGVAETVLDAVKARGGQEIYWSEYGEGPDDPVHALVTFLARRAADKPLGDARTARARQLAERAEAAGMRWLARELSALLDHPSDPRGVPGVPLAAGLGPIPKWRRRLTNLLALTPSVAKPSAAPARSAGTQRLAWFINNTGRGGAHVQPKLQKNGKRGWTAGRPIALERLHGHPEDPDLLSDHDRRALAHLERDVYYSRGYPNETYSFAYPEVFVALEGHPLLFDGDSGAPATLTRVQPTARIESKGGTVHITIHPPMRSSAHTVERLGDGRFRLVVYTEPQRAIAAVIGKELSIPASLHDELAAATKLLSSAFPVASTADAATDPETDLPVVEGASEVRVLLEPEGDGLAVQLRVRPWTGGPAFRPGAGGGSIRHTRDGQPVLVQRDLDAERRSAAELLQSCPSLQGAGDLAAGDGLIPDRGDALRLLDELRSRLEASPIEWPSGRSWELTRLADEALGMELERVGDWFRASGRLAVDEGLVLDLQELLRRREAWRGRFLDLGGDRFAALDEQLARRLQRLLLLAEESEGDRVRFHRLAVPALVDVIEGLGARTDADWAERVAALTPSEEQLTLPSTLRAELRPYQLEGVRWMATLSLWGAGACLADEMGLGKTVQALALLAMRAADGPALVVAPSSVVPGWANEAARFVPSLRVAALGSDDRGAQVAGLGPRAVLLCSYSLLANEAELLSSVRWGTIVLDEAQAIKNPSTARAGAAFALQADARIALTGTPVENRPLDLWSLFRFLNPGLLGSLPEFKARFGDPIERASDAEARVALGALARPFVLRRRKAAVLPELPSRTERILPVELSVPEATLYEALRREAVESLSEDDGVPAILGWLTKLRLASCHPQLVGAAGPSAKLAAFLELATTLIEEGGRALVFSQFVRHLALVRAELDARGMSYQYLDGSTPMAARQAAVEAFEAGQGDLFLISLRAGGTGLNLTSADQVIHLDPWWNPAVEDQASDRVHRIGQQRPVTIHKLVAAGTIEEQILALHHRKRELADALLAGADAAAGLSAGQLLELVRGGPVGVGS